MKKQATALLLLATISFSSLVKAEEVTLPVISKPSILEEGTQRELTPAQVAEILPWAKDSKVFLKDLLENIQNLSVADKVDYLSEGIKNVVTESNSKNSELLMRYTLNRGLVLLNVLNTEMDADAVGSIDVKYRILRSTIEKAIFYYEQDIDVLTKKTKTNFAKFGIEYYDFLAELNKSIFDASAQYNVQRAALEFLQWDLYRDVNNAQYASQIVKINNGLKSFPKKKLNDAQSIGVIRQMKALAKQLNLSEKKIEKREEFSVPSGKELITILAKQKLSTTIKEGVSLSSMAMKYVTTPREFFMALDPQIPNPNAEYKSALASVGYEHRLTLINMADTNAEEIHKLLRLMNEVDKVIQIRRDYLPKVNSAKEFLNLFEYSISNPNGNYKSALRALAKDSMSVFMDLNPTQAQINELTSKF